MSLFVLPRGHDQADDLIAQLTSFGEYVVNAAPEYRWPDTWVAELLIAEADEVVCLPHWEDYGFGARDHGLAVLVGKPMYLAHLDGAKHGALWRLEYEEIEGDDMATPGRGSNSPKIQIDEGRRAAGYGEPMMDLPECKGWAESDLEHAAHQKPMNVLAPQKHIGAYLKPEDFAKSMENLHMSDGDGQVDAALQIAVTELQIATSDYEAAKEERDRLYWAHENAIQALNLADDRVGRARTTLLVTAVRVTV